MTGLLSHWATLNIPPLSPQLLALPLFAIVTMADHVDPFTHDIAIQLSRTLNLTNPNDLLAKRVIQIAKNDRNANSFVRGT